MGKEKDNDSKDQKDEKKQEQDKEEPRVAMYSGKGFIPVMELMDSVKAWSQRSILSEDVDYLERKGGRKL